MNSKISLALMAACLSTSLVAQDNILDMRENYNIGQAVTVTGVVTSDDNLGSVRYLQGCHGGHRDLPRSGLDCLVHLPHLKLVAAFP